MITELPEDHGDPNAWELLALVSSDVLDPLLEGWANVEGVRFVNRSTGQRTTETVSRDGLLDLMRAVQAAERERCAKIVDVQPGTEAWEVIGGEEGLTMLRELAAQIRSGSQP